MGKKIHCVGINEAIIANLAIFLQNKGYQVTNSTEAELEPAIHSKLIKHHLFSKEYGFNTSNIDSHIDRLIIGRQINAENIEVITAKKLGIPVYTYAEYICQYAKDKQRIVLIGNKDIVAILFNIIVHILNYWSRSFDYITDDINIGIKLTDAPIILLQADPYPSSTLDPRSQFLAYQPHIALLSSMDMVYCKDDTGLYLYIDLLNKLADSIPKAGSVLYNLDISEIREIGEKHLIDVKSISYQEHPIKTTSKGQYYLLTSQGNISIPHVNKTVLQTIAGAYALLNELAITEAQFYEAISNFFDTAYKA
jgi:UDP-N-acetylmuramate: L-alanyl-gamma-D-glutamyl-meso-diaminopimelate ligase